MMEAFSYVAIAVIFLAGIIPVVIGIFHLVKENKELDEASRQKTSHPTN
jgi:cadmium resistance protein CadD (predicted permease)